MRTPGLVVLWLLSGCAVGPDFQRPAAPDVTRYTAAPLPAQTASADGPAGAAQHFLVGAEPDAAWWTAFHSPELDALVDQALRANPNLQAAQAALHQARELVLAQRGAFFPTVAASFSPSRNKTATAVLSPASASGNPYYTLTTAQLSVSYVADVFGLNARTVESLQAQADNQEFQLRATDLTLAANVTSAAIQEASLRTQRDTTRETIDIERQLLDLLRRQSELGQIADADVLAQEAALAQAEQALPVLDKQLAQQRDLLAVLCGRFPAEQPAATFTSLRDFALPLAIPVTLPSRLVKQRPDIRAAEATLHAATASVGIAVANRLPQFNLTADFGGASDKLGALFSPADMFWTVAGTVTQPIFQGGTLLHRQRAAEAALDQAGAQYRATVLTAFQNVADALYALQSDAEALRAAEHAEAAASRSLQIVRRQLDLGAVAYPTLLNAEQIWQQTRLTLVQAQAARLADTVALFQALGGGWSDSVTVAGKGTPSPAQRERTPRSGG